MNVFDNSYTKLYSSGGDDNYYLHLLFLTEDHWGLMFDGLSFTFKKFLDVPQGFIEEEKGDLHRETYIIESLKTNFDDATIINFVNGEIWYLYVHPWGYSELAQFIYLYHKDELDDEDKENFYGESVVDHEVKIETNN